MCHKVFSLFLCYYTYLQYHRFVYWKIFTQLHTKMLHNILGPVCVMCQSHLNPTKDPGWEDDHPRWDIRILGGIYKSHLGSQVGWPNPVFLEGSRVGLIFYPGWEWWDPTRNGGIPPFPPGIPCGIGGIPPGSRLTFNMGRLTEIQRVLLHCIRWHMLQKT